MCEIYIGRAIRILREKNKMSQTDLWRATGLMTGYISKLENEKIKYPKLPTIFKLARAFKIKPSEFLEYAENTKPLGKKNK